MADYKIDLDGFMMCDGNAVPTEEIMAGLRERDELKERLKSALDCCLERADRIREKDERIRQLDALAGEITGAYELAERERDEYRDLADKWRADWHSVMDQRDALAAHLGQLRSLGWRAQNALALTGEINKVRLSNEMAIALEKTPATSLARLKEDSAGEIARLEASLADSEARSHALAKERDAEWRRAEALAAHVNFLRNRFEWLFGIVELDCEDHSLCEETLRQGADDSLARHDLLKQAEALEKQRDRWDSKALECRPGSTRRTIYTSVGTALDFDAKALRRRGEEKPSD